MRSQLVQAQRVPLYGWLVAEAISLVGTRLSMVALPWFVLTTTGSATKTGLVALAEMLPLVVFKVLGGPIVDRVGARRVSITCDLASVVAVGAIPLLYDAGHLSFVGFLALVAVAGALRGPGDGAKQALVPTLVRHANVPMERATGLHSTVERSAGMLGYAAAGALIALVGPAQALLVDAVSFGLAAAVLAWSTRSLPRVDREAAEDEGPYLAQLRAGWTYLRRDRLLLGLALMIAVTNLLDLAWSAVLAPVWAQESGGGAEALGLMFAVFAGASALGSLTAAAWAARLPRFRVYVLAFLIVGAPRFVIFALGVPLWVILAASVVTGFASGFLNPVLGAVAYERIPPALVGRVTALMTSLCYAGMPVGGLLGGLLVSGVGLPLALVTCGAAYFLATMAPAVLPAFREMDRRPAPAAPTPFM